MELLDLLEQRVDSLLGEAAALRAENRRLREELAAASHKDEEIWALQDEVAREKQVRDQALARVNALLSRIQSHLEDGPEKDPARVDTNSD
ncbi:MAG: cell division protein ZapB [Desulfovibrionaceae bacterium]|nr:cell division protein ZapB [Desulfovibrionaceae bacterium]